MSWYLVWIFLCTKPRVLLAFVVKFWICVFQLWSWLISSPKYLAWSTASRIWPCRTYWCLIGVQARVICRTWHLLGLNSISQSFWPIFFKLCMDIDIRVECFGIANGLHSFIKKRVMTLDWCKNVFFLNTFRTNGCEFICGFRSNFVYALILSWLNNIFVHFQQSYGPWLM